MTGLVSWLAPWAEALLQLYRAYNPQVTSTYRSFTDQLNLYLTRATNPYPVAPPGASYHNYGRAFDVKADLNVLYAMGATWKSWGGQWYTSDPIHFQA